MKAELKPYKRLCTEYYQIDKPLPPPKELAWFKKLLKDSEDVLEPMCGSGRFLLPLFRAGVKIVGFDHSNAMISAGRKHCKNLGINRDLFSLDSFETFSPKATFSHIIIPSGSFCLITQEAKILEALSAIHQWLQPGGKFVFDIETIHSLPDTENNPSISKLERPNHSFILLSSSSKFDALSKVQTSLNKYELWDNDEVRETELEEFKLRLYSVGEMASLLSKVGFICNSITVPYSNKSVKQDAESIQIDCTKI